MRHRRLYDALLAAGTPPPGGTPRGPRPSTLHSGASVTAIYEDGTVAAQAGGALVIARPTTDESVEAGQNVWVSTDGGGGGAYHAVERA